MINQIPKKKLARFSLVLKNMLVYNFYVSKNGLNKFSVPKGGPGIIQINTVRLLKRANETYANAPIITHTESLYKSTTFS